MAYHYRENKKYLSLGGEETSLKRLSITAYLYRMVCCLDLKHGIQCMFRREKKRLRSLEVCAMCEGIVYLNTSRSFSAPALILISHSLLITVDGLHSVKSEATGRNLKMAVI